MKQVIEHLDGVTLCLQEHTVDDLVKNIEYLPEVSMSGITKEQIKEIALEFFKALCEVLILENGCYIFPEQNYGYITIYDIADYNHKDYTYDFVNYGKYYQPVLHIDYRQKKKAYYIIRFVGDMEKLFQTETGKGHYY